MSTVDFSRVRWRKSSRSGTNGNDACVEVAHVDAVAAVRDSKNAAGPVVVLPVAGWSAFLSVARHGHFD